MYLIQIFKSIFKKDDAFDHQDFSNEAILFHWEMWLEQLIAMDLSSPGSQFKWIALVTVGFAFP